MRTELPTDLRYGVAKIVECLVRAPDLLEKYLTRDSPVCVAGENDEQLELFASQVDRLASNDCLVSVKIDQESTNLDLVRVEPFSAGPIAQCDANASQDFRDRHGLRDVDVILVDLDESKLDQIGLCRHLRRRLHRPIIVISRLDSAERKVAMLDAGADDWVTRNAARQALERLLAPA